MSPVFVEWSISIDIHFSTCVTGINYYISALATVLRFFFQWNFSTEPVSNAKFDEFVVLITLDLILLSVGILYISSIFCLLFFHSSFLPCRAAYHFFIVK